MQRLKLVFVLTIFLGLSSAQADTLNSLKNCMMNANSYSIGEYPDRVAAQQARLNCVSGDGMTVQACSALSRLLPLDLKNQMIRQNFSRHAEFLDRCSVSVGSMSFQDCVTMAQLYPRASQRDLGVMTCWQNNLNNFSQQECVWSAQMLSKANERNAALNQICKRLSPSYQPQAPMVFEAPSFVDDDFYDDYSESLDNGENPFGNTLE